MERGNNLIDKYLISNCILTIDEFNAKYKGYPNEKLKEVENISSGSDIIASLGERFRLMGNFNVQGEYRSEGGNDIFGESKGFRVEVKLIKTRKAGNSSISENWDVLEDDFHWLFNEINKSNKGKRALVLGWFNAVDRFSQIVS